jgi:hypothetical protein
MGFSFEWQKICMQMAEGPSNHYHLQCVGEVPSNAREKNLGVLYPRSG